MYDQYGRDGLNGSMPNGNSASNRGHRGRHHRQDFDGGHDEFDAVFGFPNFVFRDSTDVLGNFLADGTNLKTFLIVNIVSTVLPAMISQKLCLFEIVCTARAGNGNF